MASLQTLLAKRVLIRVDDITKEQVDAIVNAANSTLLGGGGVDGTIHRASGPAILATRKNIRRLRYLDGLPIGQSVITTAGKMTAKHVIHTVGPVIWPRRQGQNGIVGGLLPQLIDPRSRRSSSHFQIFP
jgi:O-acetyl-ADP-ribose deacetylase (regulator of RNase III)